METVLQSNCIHRWLHLMEGIFRSNIDASSERLVITNLTNDLIDIYPHDDIASNFCYEFMMMLQEVKGGEYVKYDGEPYFLILQGKISLKVMVCLFFLIHQKDGLK